MKKMLALMLVFAIVLCFSGCVRYKVSAKVNKDGTADVTFLYATMDTKGMMSSGDDEQDGDEDSGELTIDSSTDDDNAEQKAKFEEAGWTVEDYADEEKEDKKYYGFTATKEGVKLDELEAEFAALGLEEGKFSFSEKDGVYTLDWDASGNTEKLTEQGVETTMLKSYGGYMTFEMELPGKVIENNATKVEGKLYQWDMLKMTEPIHCEFNLKSSGFPMWIIGVIIGGVILAAGIVVAIIIMGKKKKDTPAPAYAAPAAPEAPAAPAFTPSQSTGLPQVGAPEAPAAPAVEQAATATAPLWNQPSAASAVDSLEELEALEEEPAKPIVPDVIPPKDDI